MRAAEESYAAQRLEKSHRDLTGQVPHVSTPRISTIDFSLIRHVPRSVNLSDAFTFQEKEHQNAEADAEKDDEKDPLDVSNTSALDTESAEPELTTSKPIEVASETIPAEPNLGEAQPEAAEHAGSS